MYLKQIDEIFTGREDDKLFFLETLKKELSELILELVKEDFIQSKNISVLHRIINLARILEMETTLNLIENIGYRMNDWNYNVFIDLSCLKTIKNDFENKLIFLNKIIQIAYVEREKLSDS